MAERRMCPVSVVPDQMAQYGTDGFIELIDFILLAQDMLLTKQRWKLALLVIRMRGAMASLLQVRLGQPDMQSISLNNS